MGDVDYLPKIGNILAAYGQLLSRDFLPKMSSWADRKGDSWTMMREFAHATPGEIVFEVKLNKLTPTTNIGWNIFGAERFTF